MIVPSSFALSEQVYRSFIPERYVGLPLVKYFAERFPYLPEKDWERMILDGKITVNGQRKPPLYLVQEKDRTETRMPGRQEPPADCTLKVVFQNEHLRIFNKAAPIPVHPCGRYHKNSMTELLKERYPDEVPRPVQRLDATTTGLIVFARTRQAAAALMREFQNNRVKKEYLALVEGQPAKKSFVIETPVGKTSGSKRQTGHGLPGAKDATTRVECLSHFDGRSLLRVAPQSGRTNQIRVHLASVGHPVFNDAVYGSPSGRGFDYGLHARRLVFTCMDWKIDVTCPSPKHFKPYLELADER